MVGLKDLVVDSSLGCLEERLELMRDIMFSLFIIVNYEIQEQIINIMGNITQCCDAKSQLNNSGLSSIKLGEGTTLDDVKDFSLPVQKQEVTNLLKKAERSKFYRAPTQKQKESEKENIVYGHTNNRVLYEGQAKQGEAHGFGKASFENGSLFEGTFIEGEPQNGIFIFNENCYYVGDIVNFQASGRGVYENIENGYEYEGEWKKNLQNGKGVEKYSNNDRYEGGFMFGSKFGEGRYEFADGKVYTGSFYNGHSDGVGKLTLPNQEEYNGEWKLGKMHGHGCYSYKNGEKYEGSFENGVKSGHGTYRYKNGDRYIGEWINGLQEGEGLFEAGFDEVKGYWKAGNIIQ